MSDTPVNQELNLEEELKESYLTYAMSVLVDRALPDLRDGLKPVHRRILQAMRDLNLSPGRRFLKSAKIVGETMGNYHPHGDSAIYDAMARMAQDFSLRYRLVEGQGNFGSIDGDPPAAQRYTEARMTAFGAAMLEDIEYDTVDHRPNYDGRLEEPTVLPGKLPCLLVNGSSGIAVGMATNIPSHNLREVCAAIIHLIDHPECHVHDLMQHIKGPDFPTGAIICGTSGIRDAYETGHGRVVMRAKVGREVIEGRDALIVTEIPYGVKLGTITESIVEADKEERVKGLAKMYGGVVGDGIRLVIELKKNEDPDLVLNQLWQHTYLQATFGVNMVALDGGRPRTVHLKRMCQAYVEHRIEVIVRRTRFLLARDEARLHILAGLLKAIDFIDAIVALIRAAASVDEARTSLMERFQFSQVQAQAILDMPLRRLVGLERDKLEAEANELRVAITDYQDILARPERRFAIIKADLTELSEKWGDARRTEITSAAGDFAMEDLIEDTPVILTMSRGGYLKRMPVDTFRVQRRGGKGVSGGQLKDDDTVARIISATNHEHLLVFTNLGRLYWLRVWDIPESDRTARGKHLNNLLQLEEGEKIAALHTTKAFAEGRFLFFATRQGTVKKTDLPAYGNIRNGGIKAVKLSEGDELLDVCETDGTFDIMLTSSDGSATRFSEDDVRDTGRDTGGVYGMDVEAPATVVSLLHPVPGCDILSVCVNGYGKRTPESEYRRIGRGGKGVTSINTGERNGNLVASLSVTPGDDILIMTKLGQVIRTQVDQIRVVGRAGAGVTIIDLDPGDTVLAVELLPKGTVNAEPEPEGPPTA